MNINLYKKALALYFDSIRNEKMKKYKEVIPRGFMSRGMCNYVSCISDKCIFYGNKIKCGSENNEPTQETYDLVIDWYKKNTFMNKSRIIRGGKNE